MKNFKWHKMYFPLALALSLSPMVFKSIHQEKKPHGIERSVASVEGEIDNVKKSPRPEKKLPRFKDKEVERFSAPAARPAKQEKKEEVKVEVKKYEKVAFEKDAQKISDDLQSVDKQLIEVVLKKDKEFEQSLHDIVNEQYKKIDELAALEASPEDKKIIDEKIAELKQSAGDLCDKLEKVVASVKAPEEKVATVEEKKEEPKCDLEQKFADLTKQVDTMTADHKKYLDLIVGMSQMMVSMYQQQQGQQARMPFTYSYSAGMSPYPYHNDGMGQWGSQSGPVTNNYYGAQSSPFLTPGVPYQLSGMQPTTMEAPVTPQAQPQQMDQVQTQQSSATQYDPRYVPMNVMPGVFGDAPLMHNFESMSPMIVNSGRAPAVVPF